MTWSYEISLRATGPAEDALQPWFESGPRQALAALPAITLLDLYTPAAGAARDPYNHDGAGPAMLLLLDFAERAALAQAIAEGAIARALGTLAADVRVTAAALERRLYPVGNGAAPTALTAPFSYVVRYHRPADDEAAFISNYVDSHPPTQAKLPGIRAVLCYLPLHDLDRDTLPDADYLIGNEVAFDDIEAFNAAMASPVREELREHFRTFPRFTGAVTHYPMTRRRLVG